MGGKAETPESKAACRRAFQPSRSATREPNIFSALIKTSVLASAGTRALIPANCAVANVGVSKNVNNRGRQTALFIVSMWITCEVDFAQRVGHTTSRLEVAGALTSYMSPSRYIRRVQDYSHKSGCMYQPLFCI